MVKKIIRRGFSLANRFGMFIWLSDEQHMRIRWKLIFGNSLNLDNPQTFNEKIQWLKLHDRKPVYTQMVDKFEAKKYVSRLVGSEFIIPTYGVWDSFDEIDFDSLPDQFVLKCTHDSGGLIICRDKKKLDVSKARKKIMRSMKRNFYYANREWPYKDVKPRIIAEVYLEQSVADQGLQGLVDYKFFCFDGKPQFLYLSQGLENHATAHISFLTLDWQFAPYERSDYAPLQHLPPKPQNYEKMLELCENLSRGLPFLRVDLYEVNGKVYFSELTFSPCAGLMPFKKRNHDLEIGKMLPLPKAFD